jgi:LacI family transcriptional regulator
MKKFPRHPTLADVAARAGVGKATVSRVINGAYKVSPETLERVNQVIRELGFQPSQAARSLKSVTTRTIGIVLPRIGDPFFAICAEAAQEVVRSRGYLLTMAATDYDPQTEIDQILTLFRHRVDGILLAPSNSLSKKLVAVIDQIHLPVVAFNHPLQHSPVPSVVCDNFRGAKEATRHLIEHCYKRILCLGGNSDLYSIRERQQGYKDAMHDAGLVSNIEGAPNDYAAVEEALRAECSRKKAPEAIFAVRNLITIYALQALKRLGLRVPEDIAVIGFDDFDLASMLTPAVSVVKQPVEAIGAQAAELLFRQLQNDPRELSAGKSKVIKLRANLVLRNSCGCHSPANP